MDFLFFGESLSIETVGAGIAMFVASVMLARLKRAKWSLYVKARYRGKNKINVEYYISSIGA